MTVQKIIYGRTAYEGFAKAIGAKLGLNVKIEDGASACIDAGGVVRLPGMSTHQTADEFAVTCGVIVHELSHQFYGSHKQIDPNRSRLEHECLNAVLDVADETWIDAWFIRAGNARPGQLLESANQSALDENYQRLKDWSDPATHLWKILCVGILGARLGRIRRWTSYTAWQARKLGVDAKACFRLLRQAKLAKQSPSPTPKRFAKLLQIAAKLADLLKPFAPPDGAADNGLVMPIDAALSRGRTQKPKGSREASAQEGAEIADGTSAVPGIGGRGRFGRGAGGQAAGQSRTVEFDAGSFALLSPAVQRIAQRIAIDGDGLDRIDGLSSGPSIGQAHRLMTDGQCLARWNTNEHADGVSVSVVLDCSGSMYNRLGECAGIARSFALAMRMAGPVQTLVFGTDVRESDDFERVCEMGSTNTHAALKRATEFLSGRSGHRWIVLITDGQPNDPGETETACREAVAKGVRILTIGLGCVMKMPLATCVTAADPAHLAIELDAAGHLIERGEGVVI